MRTTRARQNLAGFHHRAKVADVPFDKLDLRVVEWLLVELLRDVGDLTVLLRLADDLQGPGERLSCVQESALGK